VSFRFGHGLLGGSIALVALDVLLTSPSTSRLAQLFAVPAAAARWLISPSVPGLPNLAKPAPTTPATPATPAAPTVPGTAPGSKQIPGATPNALPPPTANPSIPA
jgi:hypothetical protein